MSSSPNSTDSPVQYCDLVMKGGITIGVVYPLAITELSRNYLFKTSVALLPAPWPLPLLLPQSMAGAQEIKLPTSDWLRFLRL